MNMFEAKISGARIRASLVRWDNEYFVVLSLLAIAMWLLAELLLAISPASVQLRMSHGDHTTIIKALTQFHSKRPHAIGLLAGGKLYLTFEQGVQQTWRRNIPGHIKTVDRNRRRIASTVPEALS